MAFVHHHLSHPGRTVQEIGRVTVPNGRLFMYGATIEDLVEHPLNEFFPQKYEFDTLRYPTRLELQGFFEDAGFEYQTPHPIIRDSAKAIDRAFLESVKNQSVNSILKVISREDPEGFAEGVKRLTRVVEEGENSGNPRTSSISRTVYWGIKR